MIWIALNICGPPLVAFDQHADRIRPEGHRGGVKLRLAKNQSIRLLHVRNNVLFRGFAAA